MPDLRGRGLARATVSLAVDAALADGHELVLIFADDDDWPKDLYAKLGFRPVGRVRTFLRSAARRRATPPRAERRWRSSGSTSAPRRSRRSSRPATAASPSSPPRPCPLDAPRPGWAEADPARVAGGGRGGDPGRPGAGPGEPVTAIGLAGQMHGVVLAAQDGTPVRPALLWPDRRASAVLDDWRALAPDVRGRLGNPLVPGMAGPLLGWLAAHEPAALAAARWALAPKDWLRLALTGTAATEASDASATLLWDLVADDWSAGGARRRRARPRAAAPAPGPARRPPGR